MARLEDLEEQGRRICERVRAGDQPVAVLVRMVIHYLPAEGGDRIQSRLVSGRQPGFHERGRGQFVPQFFGAGSHASSRICGPAIRKTNSRTAIQCREWAAGRPCLPGIDVRLMLAGGAVPNQIGRSPS